MFIIFRIFINKIEIFIQYNNANINIKISYKKIYKLLIYIKVF